MLIQLLKTVVTFSLLIVLMFGCNSSDNPATQSTGKTPFDGLGFTGCYYDDGDDTCNGLHIVFGANGQLDSLVTEELGAMNISALNLSGGVTPDGSFGMSGSASSSEYSVYINFTGAFIEGNGSASTGSGTWNGKYVVGDQSVSFNGTWELTQDSKALTN